VTLRAPAKLNLCLYLGPRRADGKHEIRSLFCPLTLADRLVVSDAHADEVVCPGVEGPNLAGEALAGLRARGWKRSPARVEIEKRIPVAAGLGGGSADAAAALFALARLWGGAPVTLLREIGVGIGADVPFFLSGGTALGLGRGEEIYPLVDLPRHFVVIARPPFGVSTSEAYAWYDEDRAAGLREVRELQQLPVPWPTRAAQMINDLEPPVVRRHPEIAGLKTTLREAGAVAAAMSGSGSAVFGLFRGRTAAAQAVRSFERGGVEAFLTRTLTRGEHERRGRPIARRV
jgi:4-diphosphocytidyl-2-C-methyl-D-erythritol kinase